MNKKPSIELAFEKLAESIERGAAKLYPIPEKRLKQLKKELQKARAQGLMASGPVVSKPQNFAPMGFGVAPITKDLQKIVVGPKKTKKQPPSKSQEIAKRERRGHRSKAKIDPSWKF